MTFTVTELSKHLDLSSNRIHQLANDGIIPRLEGKKGFNSVESVKAYINYLKGKSKSETDERTRLDRARAEKIEMENELTRAETINTDEAIIAWSKVMQAFRARTLAIPTKAAPLMVGVKSAGEAQNILMRIINDALKELSSPDLVKVALNIQADKQKKNRKRRK